MTMTPEKAQALLDGATPGDWYSKEEPEDADERGLRIYSTHQTTSEYSDSTWDTPIIYSAMCCCGSAGVSEQADADLMVAAPDLARAYIAQAAELTRLRAKVEAADKLAEAAREFLGWGPNEDTLYGEWEDRELLVAALSAYAGDVK